jgi:hypothetical protein
VSPSKFAQRTESQCVSYVRPHGSKERMTMALWGSGVRIPSAPPASRNPCASIGRLLRFKEIIRQITRKGGNFLRKRQSIPPPAFASRLRKPADLSLSARRRDEAGGCTVAWIRVGLVSFPKMRSRTSRLSLVIAVGERVVTLALPVVSFLREQFPVHDTVGVANECGHWQFLRCTRA